MTSPATTSSPVRPNRRSGPEPVEGLVDHLFRHESGNITARLVRVFGPAHLEPIEDVVQEALIRALKRWPYDGIPRNPRAWLFRVARNRMLDVIRRDACFGRKRDEYAYLVKHQATNVESPAFDQELVDDQLALIFTCCIPELPRRAQIALTLKVACGFSVEEIATAFLSQRSTVAQRLVRAKKQLREGQHHCEVPGPDQLPERLDAVLEVIYLLFNEGYSASRGESLVRSDLCEEALRLVLILLMRNVTSTPRTHALAALIFFQSARLGSRVDDTGTSVLLADQDRSHWDRAGIARGFRHMELAYDPQNPPSVYHLQAAIAGCHVSAASFEQVDWPRILMFYDRLLERQPSPMVRLNRSVAVAYVHGPRQALADLDRIEDPTVREHYLFLATRAELLEQSGEPSAALDHWQAALEKDLRPAQRQHVQTRILALQQN